MAVIIFKRSDDGDYFYVHTVIAQGCTWVWNPVIGDPDFLLHDVNGKVPEIEEGASLSFLKLLCGGVFDDAMAQINLKAW